MVTPLVLSLLPWQTLAALIFVPGLWGEGDPLLPAAWFFCSATRAAESSSKKMENESYQGFMPPMFSQAFLSGHQSYFFSLHFYRVLKTFLREVVPLTYSFLIPPTLLSLSPCSWDDLLLCSEVRPFVSTLTHPCPDTSPSLRGTHVPSL